MSYFVVEKATPLLNTPHFSKVYSSPFPFDKERLIRAVEMVALPGMSFKIIGKHPDHILEVATEEYPSSYSLYIDERFGEFRSSGLRVDKVLPELEEVLRRMRAMVGLPYVWGGNYGAGIADWERYYPPERLLTPFEEAHWTLRGVDCSGLLYEATGGYTPRNTKELASFGREVALETIQPLDLILYPGHVMIALNDREVIESRLEFGGVKITPLETIKKPTMVRRFLAQILSRDV